MTDHQPALLQNREDQAMGAALRRCLGYQRWGLRSLVRIPTGWEAVADSFGGGGLKVGRGPTPTLALLALADRLEKEHP